MRHELGGGGALTTGQQGQAGEEIRIGQGDRVIEKSILHK